MVNRAYSALILVLILPVSVHAQDEAEPLLNGNGFCDYLLSETELEKELWEPDYEFPLSESFWIDMDELCDILLDICVDLEVTDEEMNEMLPDLWEPDYELYLFWEDDWYYWEEE